MVDNGGLVRTSPGLLKVIQADGDYSSIYTPKKLNLKNEPNVT